LIDAAAGTPVYLNSQFVVSMRPDPAEPDTVTIMRMSDGEQLRVRGGHDEVAGKLIRTAA
jgi:uncharacterized protein YlzI (FlbEa/FlbD family)